jgi:Mrp family chromosome partitioning ATPase
VIAGLTVVVLARTDRRVSGDGDLENLAGRPVVARIPRSRPAAADALVTLALSLANGHVGSAGARVLLLTSAGPEEGTPEVAIGLARGLGAVGLPAIAIETDLRVPSFARRLGVAEGGGLVAVLAGAAELGDELADIGDDAAALSAGATTELPQALLAGKSMAAVVEEARKRADVVLLAGAPAGVVGDSLALAALVDDVLLVARDDLTRRDELERAVRALTGAGIPPAGVVATVRPARRPLAGVLGARPHRRPPARRARPRTGRPLEGKPL